MSNPTEEQKRLHPSNPIIKEATLKAFQKFNGMDMRVAAENFLSKVEGAVPAPIPVKISVFFGAIYGHLIIQPTKEYANCKFELDFWGVGLVGGDGYGLMYTAYDNWDAFFKNVTSFHIQGVADGGGILQVNFFRSDATPVGQCNAFIFGIGLIEAGGPGKWSCS